jgi:hypothetical protein
MNDATSVAGPSVLQMLLGLYGYLLPLLLYVVWSALRSGTSAGADLDRGGLGLGARDLPGA